jgi:hypothetical protein
MGVAKPTGGYADRMLSPGGWPDVDEQAFYDRAQQYTQVLREATDVMDACQYQRAEIFAGGVWSGSAASAADAELGTLIAEMSKLQNGLATVITWHKYVAQTVVTAKSDVADNVVAAHRTIAELENDPSLDAEELTHQINTVVNATHAANVSIVDGTAAQVLVSKSWKPPANALQDLLDQKIPPPVTVPNAPVQPPRPTQPSAPAVPGGGGLPSPGTPGAGGPTPPGMPPLDGGGLQPVTPGLGQPGGPSPLTPVGPSPGIPGGMPGGGPAAPLAPATPATPLSPAAGAQQPGGAAGGPKGVTPASASAGVLPASARPGEAGAGAHPGATGVPAGAMGSGGSGGTGSGGRSGAYGPQSAGDKSAATQPAASKGTPQKSKPRAAQAVHSQAGDDEEVVVVVPAPVIPVSAARAERDAIADAATADASRRAGPDPLQLARRIGAALNAPDLGGGMDLGFFWVTGVTTDGAIVVANSYGLAYIPEGVQLPKQVYLASGDETIPAAERARWATYPVMAVRGWADHHDKTLRAVIGTQEQLANSDAGVPKMVLSPDDIPETGDMVGRSRLEVVDSEAAQRLTATPDARLGELLSPAPAGAGPAADLQPAPASVVDPEAAAVLVSPAAETERMGELLAEMPLGSAGADAQADDRFMLWFEVMKPMASKASGRQAAHLRAFHAYVAHAEQVLLREAHAEADPLAQRSAVAEWLYWKHLTGLLNAALADPRILSPA